MRKGSKITRELIAHKSIFYIDNDITSVTSYEIQGEITYYIKYDI